MRWFVTSERVKADQLGGAPSFSTGEIRWILSFAMDRSHQEASARKK